jgi:hypothetical protein
MNDFDVVEKERRNAWVFLQSQRIEISGDYAQAREPPKLCLSGSNQLFFVRLDFLVRFFVVYGYK